MPHQHFQCFDWIENVKGKEENAGYQHFSPFPNMFSKAFFLRLVKTQERLNDIVTGIFLPFSS